MILTSVSFSVASNRGGKSWGNLLNILRSFSLIHLSNPIFFRSLQVGVVRSESKILNFLSYHTSCWNWSPIVWIVGFVVETPKKDSNENKVPLAFSKGMPKRLSSIQSLGSGKSVWNWAGNEKQLFLYMHLTFSFYRHKGSPSLSRTLEQKRSAIKERVSRYIRAIIKATLHLPRLLCKFLGLIFDYAFHVSDKPTADCLNNGETQELLQTNTHHYWVQTLKRLRLTRCKIQVVSLHWWRVAP